MIGSIGSIGSSLIEFISKLYVLFVNVLKHEWNESIDSIRME